MIADPPAIQSRAVHLRPTFRDPAGSLTLEHDRAVRRIHPSSRKEVLEFVRSAFYERLQQRGDVVATLVEDDADGLRLIHPLVRIPTYPWEWTQTQWLSAAELTITLCREALAEGWLLKDATPLNILFAGPRPVLVDVLSFERRDPASSIWLAYGQYTRTFLLPLIMNRVMSWPLELTLFKRDGYGPQECYQAMSWRQRLSPTALWPVALPTWLEKRSGASTVPPAKRSQDAGLTQHILDKTLAGLLKRTRAAAPKGTASEWADYTSTLTHYTPGESEQKRKWVQRVFSDYGPRTVLDIGANTGEFSEMAAAYEADVVALERDAPAADRLFRLSQSRSLPIQTIHADLARPTPAVGWENDESSALLPRLEGKFELVMMLAVIHHLILMEQIPVAAILALAYRLTQRQLIVEWVPVSDPMFQSLMRGRDTLYGALSEADLLAGCEGLFRVVRRETLGNGRVLFLFEKLQGGESEVRA